jgi:hypothetical protein
MIEPMGRAAFRQMGAERADEWVAKGHRQRHFFAHRLFQLPKCGPDGFKLARAMCGTEDVNRHWQLLLFADSSLTDRFPRELFFDDDVLWHQQHLGRPGQVASVSLVVEPDVIHTMVHQSDLVQRIGRVRRHKTQIENRFRGWPWMLVNGVVACALERGIATVRTPTSKLAMRQTDPSRDVEPYMFERIYDRPPAELPGAVHGGEWWEIDVRAAAAAVVEPVAESEPVTEEATVCVTHDLERGLGHLEADPELAREAEATAGERLATMLDVEAGTGIRATYNVVGQILPSVREQIEAGGHAVAFHSFDHRRDGDQLRRCREVDYRLKGYRLPNSEPTAETTAEGLALHNFEWVASSAYSFGFDSPRLENRIVRLPVTLDDFSLYTGEFAYEQWEARLLGHVEQAEFTAVGLHDCYAHLWLPCYAQLIEKLSARARLRTLDEVSADVLMSAAA